MKENLIKLAEVAEFSSKIVYNIPYKYNHNEPGRYYLWMYELQKWILENHNLHIMITPLTGVVIVEMKNPFKTYGSVIPQETYMKVLEYGLIEALKLIK